MYKHHSVLFSLSAEYGGYDIGNLLLQLDFWFQREYTNIHHPAMQLDIRKSAAPIDARYPIKMRRGHR